MLESGGGDSNTVSVTTDAASVDASLSYSPTSVPVETVLQTTENLPLPEYPVDDNDAPEARNVDLPPGLDDIADDFNPSTEVVLKATNKPDKTVETTTDLESGVETTTYTDILVTTTAEAEVVVDTTTEADILVSTTTEADVLSSTTTEADVFISTTTEADIALSTATEADA